MRESLVTIEIRQDNNVVKRVRVWLCGFTARGVFFPKVKDVENNKTNIGKNYLSGDKKVIYYNGRNSKPCSTGHKESSFLFEYFSRK